MKWNENEWNNRWVGFTILLVPPNKRPPWAILSDPRARALNQPIIPIDVSLCLVIVNVREFPLPNLRHRGGAVAHSPICNSLHPIPWTWPSPASAVASADLQPRPPSESFPIPTTDDTKYFFLCTNSPRMNPILTTKQSVPFPRTQLVCPTRTRDSCQQ